MSVDLIRPLETASRRNFTAQSYNRNLLRIWNQDERMVELYYMDNQMRFAVTVWTKDKAPVDVTEITDCYQTIVGIPEELKMKSEVEKRIFFSHAYLQLTSFGNGYKIYLNQQGLGGVSSLEDTIKLDDNKMARAIHEQLPDRTVTSVNVRSETYKFQNGLKGIPVKAIIFKLDGYDRFFKGLKAALAGMGVLNPNQYDKINEALLKDQIISCAVNNTTSSFSEVEKAASQCDSFVVYIATDLSNAELTSLKNDKILGIFRLSGVIKYLIEIGISLVKQLKESKT